MIISEYLISPEKLARDLVEFVDRRPGIDAKSDKYWTRAVMDGLCEIAAGTKLEPLHTNKSKGISEFMLDFAAWSRDGNEGIVLAAESEWAAGRGDATSYAKEVVADFWKLLCVKSPAKLMVFASDAKTYPSGPIIAELRKAFESYRHHIPREQYIFIDFAPGDARKAFYVKVPASVGDSVPFVPIPISLDLVELEGLI